MSDPRYMEVSAPARSPTTEALRAVVRSHVNDGSTDDALGAAARVICLDAHARGVQIVELLVSIKHAWPELASNERLPRMERARLLDRVITLCVQEYYAAPR